LTISDLKILKYQSQIRNPQLTMSYFIVAIIGRPNVGKSTLFNRLLGERDAIVDSAAGVTRDRHYGEAEWAGRRFTIVDTGGFVPHSIDVFDAAIREQAQIAIEEADIVVFLVDVASGITPLDSEIAEVLRKANKKVLLAVNKVDSDIREPSASAFYKFGLGDPIPIAALPGRNIGDFLDLLVHDFPAQETVEEESDSCIKLAVIGKPNVGKSSFVNALLGQERSIVTPIPGTTRDAIDSRWKYSGQEYLLIDTAGLRKRSKIRENIEFFSTLRTLKSIRRCDVALVFLDATTGLEKQDTRVLSEAADMRKGIVLVVNKWDLVEKDTNTARRYEEAIRESIKTLDYVPIVFVSALTKQRIYKVIDTAQSVYAERAKRVKTSELNDALLPEIKQNPPWSATGKEIKINYLTQVSTSPPVIAFFTNEPTLIAEQYRRFLERKIRRSFGFIGVPLTLVFKGK
jgi:GTP-binding protein